MVGICHESRWCLSLVRSATAPSCPLTVWQQETEQRPGMFEKSPIWPKPRLSPLQTQREGFVFVPVTCSKGAINQPFYDRELRQKMWLKSAWPLPTALLGVTGKYPVTTQIKRKLLHSISHWDKESGYLTTQVTDKTLCTLTNPLSKSGTQPWQSDKS